MAQSVGRITCPKCGANNFDKVTTCWKCHATIGSGASASSSTANQTVAVQPSNLGYPASPPIQERAPYAQPPISNFSQPVRDGDMGMAKRAAFLLAMTFPWIGLPVGWVFMMLQDKQKQTVGRFCASWSIFSFVLHSVVFFFIFATISSNTLRLLVPMLQRTMQSESPQGFGTERIPRGLE